MSVCPCVSFSCDHKIVVTHGRWRRTCDGGTCGGGGGVVQAMVASRDNGGITRRWQWRRAMVALHGSGGGITRRWQHRWWRRHVSANGDADRVVRVGQSLDIIILILIFFYPQIKIDQCQCIFKRMNYCTINHLTLF